MTVGGDTIPMVLNHLCKLLIRFKPLPLQAVFPSIKEGTGAALREIIPELAERLFQQVSGIQTSIGAEQFFERRRPSRLRFSRLDNSV